MSVGSRAILERITQRLRGVYGGRSWLVATDTLPAATAIVGSLRALGATRCFVVAASDAAGDPPDPRDAEVRVLGVVASPDPMTTIRRAEQALANVPASIADAVDRFDPYGSLRVIGDTFSTGVPVAGRAPWGARPPTWQALEDKTTVDALWDAVGVARADAEVVPLDPAALRAAATRVDRGAGTVWAADASLGFHGGASYTRPVRTADDEDAALHAFRGCARVRVMPLLDGVPCSLAGVVLPDRVLTLRPSELFVLRRPDGRFVYAGVGNTWDAPAALEAELRAVVVRTGAHLRDTVGYRGTFVVDGIATADGFRPTELNPRVGASLSPQVGDFPFVLVHLALVEGRDVVVDGAAFEAALRVRAAERRFGRAVFPVARTVGPGVHRLRAVDDDVVPAIGGHADATLRIEVGPTGATARVDLDPIRTPHGPSAAPRIAAAIRWADERLKLGIGPLLPATAR